MIAFILSNENDKFIAWI